MDIKQTGSVKKLLKRYKVVVGASKRLSPIRLSVKRIVETTADLPVSPWYWRLDPERLATANAEFAAMESQGIIRRSKSNWSSLLHLAKKADI